MCVGCPVTQWYATIQPLKTGPELLWQIKSYGLHTLMTYVSLLTRMQKKASCQNVFRMISSAPDLKHILQKLNIFGQRQIIQPVPVVLDCLGHFVPIYSAVQCSAVQCSAMHSNTLHSITREWNTVNCNLVHYSTEVTFWSAPHIPTKKNLSPWHH